MKKAFSLIEVIVMLTVTSIIIAASTPIITRKIVNNAEGGTSLGGGTHGRYEFFLKEVISFGGSDEYSPVPNSGAFPKVTVYEKHEDSSKIEYEELQGLTPLVEKDGSYSTTEAVGPDKENKSKLMTYRKSKKYVFEDNVITYEKSNGSLMDANHRIIEDNLTKRNGKSAYGNNLWLVQKKKGTVKSIPWERLYSGQKLVYDREAKSNKMNFTPSPDSEEIVIHAVGGGGAGGGPEHDSATNKYFEGYGYGASPIDMGLVNKMLTSLMQKVPELKGKSPSCSLDRCTYGSKSWGPYMELTNKGVLSVTVDVRQGAGPYIFPKDILTYNENLGTSSQNSNYLNAPDWFNWKTIQESGFPTAAVACGGAGGKAGDVIWETNASIDYNGLQCMSVFGTSAWGKVTEHCTQPNTTCSGSYSWTTTEQVCAFYSPFILTAYIDGKCTKGNCTYKDLLSPDVKYTDKNTEKLALAYKKNGLFDILNSDNFLLADAHHIGEVDGGGSVKSGGGKSSGGGGGGGGGKSSGGGGGGGGGSSKSKEPECHDETVSHSCACTDTHYCAQVLCFVEYNTTYVRCSRDNGSFTQGGTCGGSCGACGAEAGASDAHCPNISCSRKSQNYTHRYIGGAGGRAPNPRCTYVSYNPSAPISVSHNCEFDGSNGSSQHIDAGASGGIGITAKDGENGKTCYVNVANQSAAAIGGIGGFICSQDQWAWSGWGGSGSGSLVNGNVNCTPSRWGSISCTSSKRNWILDTPWACSAMPDNNCGVKGSDGYLQGGIPTSAGTPKGVGKDDGVNDGIYNERFTWSIPFAMKRLGYGESGNPGNYATTKISNTEGTIEIELGKGGVWTNNDWQKGKRGPDGTDTIVSLIENNKSRKVLVAQGGKGGKSSLSTSKFNICYGGDKNQYCKDANGTAKLCCTKESEKSTREIRTTATRPSDFDKLESFVQNSRIVGIGLGKGGEGAGNEGGTQFLTGERKVMVSSAGTAAVLPESARKLTNILLPVNESGNPASSAFYNNFYEPPTTRFRGGDGAVLIVW